MILLLFWGACFAFVLWEILFEKVWHRGLTADLFFEQDHAYEGDQAKIVEVIENAKRMPLPVLEASFQIPRELQFSDMENTTVSDSAYKLDIFSALGNQRIKRHLTFNCTKRGCYHVSQVELCVRSLFYRYRYQVEQSVDSTFYVYAKRTNVSHLVSFCEKLMAEQQCAKYLYEDPFAFSSIREYEITDPMKQINWKASAKTGNLMVNTYDSTKSEQMMIYLDLEDGGIIKQEREWEESIRIAASVARKLLQKGAKVGIAVNIVPGEADVSQKKEFLFLPPEFGERQLIKIEQMLARRMPEEEICSFDQILQEKTADASVLFISKNVNRSQSAIEQALPKEQEGIWVIPAEEEITLPSTRRNLHVYRKEVARC
ncbi:MAG: DUF58 domain-containing protein [Lachnospiraceae bacterium]